MSREQAAVERSAADASRQQQSSEAIAVELADLLAQLSDEAREVVVLRIWGQLSWQEIGELAGTSKSSAQRLYVEALAKLRQLGEPLECPTN